MKNFFISISVSKKSVYLFCNNNATIDCHTIRTQIYESINNNAINDESNNLKNITKDDLQSYNIYVFLDSILLTGGVESVLPNNELFFGTLDSNDNSNFNANDSVSNNSNDSNNDLDESKPIYYLECDLDSFESYESNSQDSNESTQTLQIFLHNHTLTILNYSILDSSLNITLQCKSNESKAIQQNEINQRKQLESSKQILDSNSIALLCPILECDELKCIHGGIVKLKSNVGKSIRASLKANNNALKASKQGLKANKAALTTQTNSLKASKAVLNSNKAALTTQSYPLILETDLLHSKIINCPNNIAGLPSPCTQIALILPNARGLKKYNDDYPIMQDLCVSGVFSDKGFAIICTKQENTMKIKASKPTDKVLNSKEGLRAKINSAIPVLNIITAFDDLTEYYLSPSTYENRTSREAKSQAKFYETNKYLELEFKPLNKDELKNDLSKNSILKPLLEELTQEYNQRDFAYRIFSLRIAYTIYEYILIIPKKLPKFIAKLLKEKRNDEEMKYGYGSFVDLQRAYLRELDECKEKEVRLNIQGQILLAPCGMERLRMVVR